MQAGAVTVQGFDSNRKTIYFRMVPVTHSNRLSTTRRANLCNLTFKAVGDGVS